VVVASFAAYFPLAQGVIGFLTTSNARALRLVVSRMCHDDVAAARWRTARSDRRQPRLSRRTKRTFEDAAESSRWFKIF
jgi:hypothetical protein